MWVMSLGLIILMGAFALLFLMCFVLSLILWFKIDYGDELIEQFIMVILLTAMSLLSGGTAFGLITNIVNLCR